jgi:hypothetical protein
MAPRKLTPQAAFNRVAKHLLRQNEKSIAGDECLYRGPRGLRCAVGALIPRRIKVPECGVWTLLQGGILGKKSDAVVAHFGGDEAVEELLPLLEALQVVHDALAVEEWREALAGVADDFNLSPAVLEATP